MSSFKLTILGSSSALPTAKRFPTAHVLNVHERFFLFDCGEGTQIQLRRYKIKLGKLNHIFISHAHGDHVFGLYGLISTLDLLGKKNALNIYAHKSLKVHIDHFLKYFAGDLHFEVIFNEINPSQSQIIWESDRLFVQTIPLKHRVPTCGFLVKEKKWPRNIIKEKITEYNISITDINRIKKGEDLELENNKVIPNSELTLKPFKQRSYAYCSDTRYTETILDYVKNVDLLYHEATFLNNDEALAKKTYHSTAQQAAKIANKANAGKLLLGHISARYKNDSEFVKQAKEEFKNSVLVNDGDSFEIPLMREK